MKHPSLATSLLLITLAACAPTVANRGNIPDPDRLAEIKEGESTREDVESKLGTPSQVGTFDENIWYYYGRTTEQTAFFDPKVVKQESVEIHFNDEGTVTQIAKLSPPTQEITPTTRRTPTYGHETTLIEQVVGNLGRKFNKDPKEKK